jgi:SAM-dependent methyltransferase
MSTLSLTRALGQARTFARTRLTLRGPRAYADTHAVALDLMTRAYTLPSGERRMPRGPVLDLGAGRGELSRELDKMGCTVTAVERYTPQFEARASLVDADLNLRWPFEDESFDAAMGIEVLEHLENPRFFFRELSRVLRPGGLAVVSTPNLTSVLSRLLFVSCGQWDLFFNHPWRLRDPYSADVEGHITPLPRWLMYHHARDSGLEVRAHAYSRGYLPGVPWRLNPLPSNGAFGRVLLALLRKELRFS